MENANHHSMNDFSDWPGSVIDKLFIIIQLYEDGMVYPAHQLLMEMWESHASYYLDNLDEYDPEGQKKRLDYARGLIEGW